MNAKKFQECDRLPAYRKRSQVLTPRNLIHLWNFISLNKPTGKEFFYTE
ncbi:hypothetical protein [Nostoc commune]|nr:hypothetical protein [Nostoc commune]